MAKEIYNASVTETNRGIFLDCELKSQPKGTRRFTLNAVEDTIDGINRISNEPSNYACDIFTEGFTPIGDRYIGNDTSVVMTTNQKGLDEIGLINKNNKYTPLVHTGVLGLKITHQCDIIFRIRRSKERVIYWVDGYNNARTLNLDRLHNFYSRTYAEYLSAGNDPNTFVGEKWDMASFDLIKRYSLIPTFNNLEELELGSILPGSYNFSIQLVDEDLNPTEWITTSNTINIYNDSKNNSYDRIRGSRNIVSSAQSWDRANKSIKLSIGNLDTSFPYYRVAIIRAAGNNGEPEKVLLSDLYSTGNSTFIYSGNDSSLKEGTLGDIMIDGEIIYAPKHIEQMENRVILANGRGKDINWCEFQAYASKIKTDLVTKPVILNSVNSDGNVKNPNSTFILGGNMPGEVASYGIVYICDDGFVSPALHIPGKNQLDTTSKMKYYETTGKYLDVHNCSTSNYWGRDAMGKTLVGKPIRHHRFPFRHEVNKPLVTSTGDIIEISKYRLKITVTLNPTWTPGPIEYPTDGENNPLLLDYIFIYQVQGAGSTTTFSGQLTDTIVANGGEFVIYDDSTPLNSLGTTYSQLEASSELGTYQTTGNERFIIEEEYEEYSLSSDIKSDVSEVFGISFSNIEKPHPSVIGFYIVKNEKTEEDRLIVDNAIFGSTLESQQYISFGLINPKQYYPVNNCGRQASSDKTITYNDKTLWFFNPEFQFLGKKTEFNSVEIEGKYEETSVDMPTISDTDNSACNGGPGFISRSGGSKGLLITDVQAGTSYNPDVNKKKDKDDDGFDLLVGYRNLNTQFIAGELIEIPEKDRILYLNAASYQNYQAKTYYNVSVDNKIGLLLMKDTFDTNEFFNVTTKKNSLFYGSLVKNNQTAYSNFIYWAAPRSRDDVWEES